VVQTNQLSWANTPGYCIDTSALIQLEPYYQDVFNNLWLDLEKLVIEHLLVAPKLVYDEFDEKFPDSYACKKWLKRHNNLFMDNRDVWTNAKIIQSRYPGLTSPEKPKKKADYFVIALAQNMGSWTVITEERTNRKISIRYVCDQLNIPCINLYNFFKKCKWKY
jgi:hypothetical protein